MKEDRFPLMKSHCKLTPNREACKTIKINNYNWFYSPFMKVFLLSFFILSKLIFCLFYFLFCSVLFLCHNQFQCFYFLCLFLLFISYHLMFYNFISLPILISNTLIPFRISSFRFNYRKESISSWLSQLFSFFLT